MPNEPRPAANQALGAVLVAQEVNAGSVLMVSDADVLDRRRNLVILVSGQLNGRGEPVAYCIAVRPDQIARFLSTLVIAAELHFPDQFPATD